MKPLINLSPCVWELRFSFSISWGEREREREREREGSLENGCVLLILFPSALLLPFPFLSCVDQPPFRLNNHCAANSTHVARVCQKSLWERETSFWRELCLWKQCFQSWSWGSPDTHPPGPPNAMFSPSNPVQAVIARCGRWRRERRNFPIYL